MHRLESKPVGWLRPDPNQPRKLFDEAELRLLGESLKKRQLQPILAKPDGTIIAGERRYKAALLVGLEKLDVIVTEEPLTDADIRGIQLVENIHRSSLSAYEMWRACEELLEINPAWQGKDLAAHLHLDPSSITRILSTSKIIPEAKEALKQNKIGISDAYAMSKVAIEDQHTLLAMKLHGASRDALEQAAKKKQGESKSITRTSKIKCPLTSGVTVIVTAKEISLDEAIDALKEAMKAMKKARDTGLDAKTAQAVWTDIAKAV